MKNFTLEQKQELYDLAGQGAEIIFVAYDPSDVIGDPEATAASEGLVEFYREEDANLVEIIYIPAAFGNAAGVLALSAATYEVDEEDGQITITINRNGGTEGAVSVRIATSDGTGTAGVDYTAVDTVVEWEDGDGESKTINITVLSDDEDEENKTFNITLSEVESASLGLSSAVVTIVDDDEPLPVIELTSALYSVSADSGPGQITVTRKGPSTGSCSARIVTSGGTAVPNVDYTPVDTIVTWDDGDTSTKVVNIPVIDTGDGETKTVNVDLTDAEGALLGLARTAVLLINEEETVSDVLMVQKAADTSISLDNSFNLDPDLVFENLAPGRYAFTGCVYFTTSAAFGVRAGFQCSTDTLVPPSGYGQYTRQGSSFAKSKLIFSDGGTTNGASYGSNAGDDIALTIEGIIIVTETSTLNFAWAQFDSNAGTLTAKAGSWITLTGPLA